MVTPLLACYLALKKGLPPPNPCLQPIWPQTPFPPAESPEGLPAPQPPSLALLLLLHGACGQEAGLRREGPLLLARKGLTLAPGLMAGRAPQEQAPGGSRS